jgi:hypothetical protein
VLNKLPAKPDMAAEITTAVETRITVAITGEIALLANFRFFRVLITVYLTNNQIWF